MLVLDALKFRLMVWDLKFFFMEMLISYPVTVLSFFHLMLIPRLPAAVTFFREIFFGIIFTVTFLEAALNFAVSAALIVIVALP